MNDWHHINERTDVEIQLLTKHAWQGSILRWLMRRWVVGVQS